MVNPDRIQGITDTTVPLSKTAVRRFLGMISQFRAHIKNYAQKSAALNSMVKKVWPASWSRNQVPEDAVDSFNVELTCMVRTLPRPGLSSQTCLCPSEGRSRSVWAPVGREGWRRYG